MHCPLQVKDKNMEILIWISRCSALNLHTLNPSHTCMFYLISYNPYDGPNDHPEAELPLVAGKYLYVYGDMDDDGFYEGEEKNTCSVLCRLLM